MFRLTVKTENAAFDGVEYGPELARILRDVADQMEASTAEDDQDIILRDTNGNKVGVCHTHA